MHGGATFTRGNGLSNLARGRAENNAKNFTDDFTDDEMQQMVSDIVKSQNNTTLYLRGSAK